MVCRISQVVHLTVGPGESSAVWFYIYDTAWFDRSSLTISAGFSCSLVDRQVDDRLDIISCGDSLLHWQPKADMFSTASR